MWGLSEMSTKKKHETIIMTSIFGCSEEKNYSKGYNAAESSECFYKSSHFKYIILRAKIVSFWWAFQ